MKSYTDFEQSKKLADILPIESADMYYPWDIDSKSFLNIPIVKDDSYYVQGSIPCWSLVALLSVLPKYIGGSVLRMDMSENDFNLWFDDLSGIVDEILPDITKDNSIDVCYEMILKLKEKNLL